MYPQLDDSSVSIRGPFFYGLQDAHLGVFPDRQRGDGAVSDVDGSAASHQGFKEGRVRIGEYIYLNYRYVIQYRTTPI